MLVRLQWSKSDGLCSLFPDLSVWNATIMQQGFSEVDFARHSNCDCLYLSQNYFKLPCQTMRKCKFLLSVSSRPKEYWSHIQRPHVPRHDERTVQKTLQTRVVSATQFCCDWFDLTKELRQIQTGVWRLLYYRINGKHITSRKNCSKHWVENFNSDCCFRKFNKNKDDF